MTVGNNIEREGVVIDDIDESFGPQGQYLDVSFVKITWNSKKAIAINMENVTAKESIIALKVADENKDKVIASISHELRTPVNAIVGLISMMKKENRSQAINHFLDLCKSNAYLLMTLLNSILDLNLIRSEKLQLSASKFSLKELVEEIQSCFEF